MPTDAATLLDRLVMKAGVAVDRPGRARDDETELAELCDAVARTYKMAAPDGRLIHDEDHLLAQALVMHASAQIYNDTPRAVALQQVIGVLLPIARTHFAAACEARRRGIPANER